MRRNIFVVALVILTVFGANAFDFEYNYLQYSILPEEEIPSVEVSGLSSAYKDTKLTIPASVWDGSQEYRVKAIGNHAFEEGSQLVNVSIEPGIESIGESAFENCSSLKHINLPETINSIGAEAFAYCSSLTSVALPNSVLELEDKVFTHCTSLESITLPENLIKIGSEAFSYCRSLLSISIPNTVTEMKDRICLYCTSLVSATLPERIETITVAMFDGCTSLKTITIPETVKEIEDWAFGLCNSLEYIFIPASVEKIEPAPDFPFFGCYNLTLEVSEDNQYYSSANDMLFNKDKTVLVKSFSKTAEVAIPDGVESIEGEAFWGLTAIRQLTFPASVKLIGPTCCVDCMNLKTVICLPTTPPFSSPDVWTNYDNADGSHDLLPCKYFVPAESLDLYNQARGWQNLKGYIYPYNPAGVGSISPEDKLLDIYDINGVTIKRNATPDALDALPAGLYIVNGQKVVVR